MREKNLPDFGFPEDTDEAPSIPQGASVATETIDLEGISGEALNLSGSFDITGAQTSSFGKLLQSLPIPAFLVDRRLNIAFVNQACSHIDKGYKDILGRPFSSIFVNESAGKDVRNVLETVFSYRKSQICSTVLQIGASRIWGRMNLRPLRMKDCRSVLVLVEDLTLEKKQLLLTRKHQEELRKEIIDRKRTAEALRKSEEKYRNIIESIQDGYYEVDMTGKLILFNDNVCEITGYPAEELRSMTYQQFMDEENAAKTFAEFNKIISTEKPIKVFDHEVVRKDGARRNVSISISLMRDSFGQPSGFRGICRDVTEAKRAEEQLLRIQKVESLGVLAGGIAHDFNNILTAIMGNISLAKMSPDSRDNVTRRLGEAEKGIARARNLTQQLLTFSRGGEPISKTVSAVRVVRESCEFAVRGSNVRCEFSPCGEIYPVDVDAGQISQVISNLVVNAEQAMPEGGVIRVRLENTSVGDGDGLPLETGKYVKLSIQDQGVGIPAKILPKIFDPYFTTKQKGSGLGLATAYSIVKSHGGLITVDSESGVGATFHIYLPASDKAITEQQSADGSLVTGQGKILLMDDEETIRDMATEMLSMLGYDVDVARDGEEAVELYRMAKDLNSPYVAVILDLTIPGGMGGKETVRRLREMTPGIRAIVSSGYSNDPIMSKYEKYGFSGVVAKPYSAEELSRTLDGVIKGSLGRPLEKK